MDGWRPRGVCSVGGGESGVLATLSWVYSGRVACIRRPVQQAARCMARHDTALRAIFFCFVKRARTLPLPLPPLSLRSPSFLGFEECRCV